MVFKNNLFTQFRWQDHVAHYRCNQYALAKCPAQIRVDEKLRYAVEIEKHSHRAVSEIAKNILRKPKATTSQASRDTSMMPNLIFNKDVTSKVELITDDHEQSAMFLEGFKYTKHLENSTFIR